jgi:hypothetical protein
MLNSKNRKSTLLLYLIIGCLFLVLTNYLKYKIKPQSIVLNRQKTAINFAPSFYTLFNLGQKRLISSYLWINTLLNSDIDHYENDKLDSWFYLRLETITNIDQRFYEAYLYGGQYLSVIKDDKKGAELIFTKGLKQFPQDYDLNFYTGFHYYFELGLPKVALKHYEKIYRNPKTQRVAPYLPSLVAKLKISQGYSLKNAFNILSTTLLQSTDERLREKIKKSLYALKAEIDLKCLNQQDSNKKSCKLTDYQGNPYIHDVKSNTYSARQLWKPFRLKGKSSPPSQK